MDMVVAGFPSTEGSQREVRFLPSATARGSGNAE